MLSFPDSYSISIGTNHHGYPLNCSQLDCMQVSSLLPMLSSDSYYNDSYDYDFHSYDSGSVSESDGEITYDIKPDQTDSSSSDIPQATIPDPSVAICFSLEQSKQLIEDRFHCPSASLRCHNVSGIVVIPLKDINLIRKDTRHKRFLPHMIVFPTGDDFQTLHPDFAQSINILN